MGHWRRTAQRIGAVASATACGALMGCALLSGASDLTVGDVDGDGAAPTTIGGDVDGAGMRDGAVLPVVDGGGGRDDAAGDAKTDAGVGEGGSRLRNVTFEDGTLTGVHGGDSTFGNPFVTSGVNAISGNDSLAVDKGTSGIQVDVPTLTEVYATALVRIGGFGLATDYTIFAFVPESGGTIAELHVQLGAAGPVLVLEVGGVAAGSTSGVVVANTNYRVGFHLRQNALSNLIEVFLAPAGMAFGAPFATSNAQVGRTIGVRMGDLAATNISGKGLFDDLLIDTAAMPGP